MNTWIRAAACLLITLTIAHSEDDEMVNELRSVTSFFPDSGQIATEPDGTLFLDMLLNGDNAESNLVSVYHSGTIEAKAYALLGLHALSSDYYKVLKHEFLSTPAIVDQDGCIRRRLAPTNVISMIESGTLEQLIASPGDTAAARSRTDALVVLGFESIKRGMTKEQVSQIMQTTPMKQGTGEWTWETSYPLSVGHARPIRLGMPGDTSTYTVVFTNTVTVATSSYVTATFIVDRYLAGAPIPDRTNEATVRRQVE